ncbi:YheC/YheD family protein [Paenibacillus soyae]|uniref:YheC/YheD family protein n=1 Tax=Paenibacillus soyae TaxID=2969249 RepID=UPI0027D46663|nr:YheC/YheD family protein [Paenibacillus soyae]
MAKNYASRNIRGKLRVCDYMRADSKLREYVPRTVAFNRANLEMMTDRYSAVYVKPDVGSQGIGVCRVRKTEAGYELKTVEGKKQWKAAYETIEALYNRIVKLRRSKLIVQQGIGLDRVKGRPYDIRAMVQRKPGKSWECTGYMVKVGGANKIVTNYYQGGAIYTLRRLEKERGLSSGEGKARKRMMTEVALRIASTLSARRSGMHEMGIDFAFDGAGRLWVLEVNSNHPQFHPLKQLAPKMYYKMQEFAESYGRYSAK